MKQILENTKQISVSAPGKLMLLGEHAVVYDHPCLVTAVGERLLVVVERTKDTIFRLHAPDVGIEDYSRSMSELCQGEISRGCRFVEKAIDNFRKLYPFTGGMIVTTISKFSGVIGFGSSSASTAAIVTALAKLFDRQLSQQELFQIAYQTVVDIQGQASGFDVAAALYGGTLYFETGGKNIESIATPTLPLIVAYSGVKANTSDLIKQVAEKRAKFPEKVNRIFTAIEKLVIEAKENLIEGDWERVGKLMDFDQEYLRDLGVSSDKLENLIIAAKSAGAWGAKLSGAGGGDCMISVVSEDKKRAVIDAINKAGGQVIDVSTNVEGVRVEQI
jgi:mevalonate kinase